MQKVQPTSIDDLTSTTLPAKGELFAAAGFCIPERTAPQHVRVQGTQGAGLTFRGVHGLILVYGRLDVAEGGRRAALLQHPDGVTELVRELPAPINTALITLPHRYSRAVQRVSRLPPHRLPPSIPAVWRVRTPHPRPFPRPGGCGRGTASPHPRTGGAARAVPRGPKMECEK